MEMQGWWWFAGGVGALLVSADVLVKSATTVAAKYRLSPLIIGTTVVAIGTSLPELIVSLVASFKGDPGLAVGNILGSNTTNLLLVLALAMMLTPIRIGTTKTQRNALLMLGLTGVLAGVLAWWWTVMAGGILLVGVVGFSYLEYAWGVKGRKKEDKKQLRGMVQATGWYAPMLLCLSVLGVIAGGYMTVNGAELIAVTLGVSSKTIGLTLVAVATSLPEIMVTVVSGIKKEAKLAVGNILGSNIYNILLIGGTTALLTGGQKLNTQGLVPFGLSAAVMTALLWKFKGQSVPRWVSGLLLLSYGGYVVLTLG